MAVRNKSIFPLGIAIDQKPFEIDWISIFVLIARINSWWVSKCPLDSTINSLVFDRLNGNFELLNMGHLEDILTIEKMFVFF